MWRVTATTLVIFAGVAAAQNAPTTWTGVGGNPPTYSQRALSAVPNAAAVRQRFWSPRLADGWVPQGVAAGGGYLWVAAYQSTDPKQSRGPCRVFQLDPGNGAVAGQFDLPAACGHAGGITHNGDRILYVADGRALWRIDTQAALAAGRCVDMGCSSTSLKGALRADWLAYRDGMLWLGAYRKAAAETALAWRIPESGVMAQIVTGGGALDAKAADRTIAIAAQSQGAAVAPDGSLWITQSSGNFGRLQHVDSTSGNVIAEFAMAAGIEDIEFGPDGQLWAVSEAGSRRWNTLPTFYPLVFSIDVGALR
ncbi:MAG: hypothetical protein ABI777_14205 [Betaproteobacteria bacterium]